MSTSNKFGIKSFLFGAVAGAALGALGLLAFQNITPAPTPQLGKIYVLLPSVENPFWLEVRSGVEKAIPGVSKQFQVEIKTTANTDGADQIDQMNAILARGDAAGIVLAPTNDRAPVPIVKQFNDKGVEVVLIDTELNAEAKQQSGATWDGFVGSDNRSGGAKAAEAILKALGAGAASKKVLLLKGSYVHQSAIDRAEGFLNAANGKFLVIEKDGDWSKIRANEIVSGQFSREPVAAIFASNDEMALGAVAALKNLGIPANRWPIIIGFDATAAARAAISRREMYGSVQQQAAMMGADGLNLLAAEVNDGRPPAANFKGTTVPVKLYPEELN